MSAWNHHHTIEWITRLSRPMILGLLATTVLCACVSSPQTTEKNLLHSSNHPPSAAPSQANSPDSESKSALATVAEGSKAEAAQEAVSEPKSEPESEPATLPRLKRIDPGAAYLAQTIREQHDARAGDVGATDAGKDDVPVPEAASPRTSIVINVSAMRNQSRSRPTEFTAFLDRFAELLTDAGESHGLLFTSDADVDGDYDLLGTAYLLTADGFDWWELFINLRRTDDARMLWRCKHPVRVMRHPRPEHQQVFLVPLPRVRH